MCVITPAMMYELALPFTALAAFLKVIWPRGTPLGSFGQPCRLQRRRGFRSVSIHRAGQGWLTTKVFGQV